MRHVTTYLREQDITGADIVEVLIRRDGKVIWINVDGICCLRVCRIKKLTLKDERKEKASE